MDWNAYRIGYGMGYEMGYEAAIREYEERTFADYIDDGYDIYATEEEDAYDE